MGLPGLAGDDGEAAADGFEQRADLGERRVFAGGDDPELARFGDGGTAEDGRADVMLAALLMSRGDAARERDADGGERDVDGAGLEGVQKSGLVSLLPKRTASVAASSVSMVKTMSACAAASLVEAARRALPVAMDSALSRSAVPERYVVAFGKQQARDGRAHLAEAEKG